MGFVADTGKECGLSSQLRGECLDGAKGRLTDVMFHSLHITIDDMIIDAEQL